MRLNSYDDWSPLREIVVGSAENYLSHERDMSFDLFFYDQLADDDNNFDKMYYPSVRRRTADKDAPEDDAPARGRHRIKQRYVDELVEDVEGLAEVLSQLSVTVLRPRTMRADQRIRTLAWEADAIPPLNIRDNALILGDEIIETPPQVRARYHENQFLAEVFGEYFGDGARWTVMPRPLMTDRSFDRSYAAGSPGGPAEYIDAPRPSVYDVGLEMMFDGAQCLRLGGDIMVNIATANHELAVRWLERHLAGRFRIHRVHNLADNHIDSKVIALRPGLLLVRNQAVADMLPPQLQKWDMIMAPPPDANNFPAYDDGELILTSKYIDMNVLSVSPDTVLVNEACPELIKTLEAARFTVVPVRHRHRRLFGGGFHCFTLDTVREGSEPEFYLD
ncbi:glycine amidinotransferase [Kitasatospora sp. NPDC056783]|uniref:glycine amidinotransferase n=1 Tax=Kitasatospora sp. NPDC056783 TaxID=3345943 RepID=UPI0036A35CBF